MNVLFCFAAIFASLSCMVHGACDPMQMQTKVETCMAQYKLNSGNVSIVSVDDACNKAVLPMMNCLEQDIRGCMDEFSLPMNFTYMKQVSLKICTGMDEFMSPTSSRKCNVNNMDLMTCFKNSGLMKLGNISSIYDLPSVNWYCDGRIDSLLQCVDNEISDCELLFGINIDMAWIRNMGQKMCRFLKREKDCDLGRIAITAYDCAMAAAKKNKLDQLDNSMDGKQMICGTTLMSDIVDCMAPSITACGRMMTMDFDIPRFKETIKLICDNYDAVISQTQCLQNYTAPLQECGKKEGKTFIKSQTEYFTDNTDFTIEAALNQFLCRLMTSSETCFYDSVGKCGPFMEIGKKALTVAIPYECTLAGVTGGSVAVTFSILLMLSALFLKVVT